MALSKSLMTVLAVVLVAGGGVAAVGMAQTDAGAGPDDGVSALDMDATLDNGTVTVTVADNGTPVENASLTVEGEEDVTAVTDTDGIATVNASALAEDNESLEELEVEYESGYAEGELEYVVENGSLTLVEEEYEYEVEDEEAEDEEESEEAEDDDEESEEESEEADDEEAEDDDEDDEEESEEEEDDEDDDEGEADDEPEDDGDD